MRLITALHEVPLIGLCMPDLTTITSRVPQHICHLHYDDCSNTLTAALILCPGVFDAASPLELPFLGQ